MTRGIAGLSTLTFGTCRCLEWTHTHGLRSLTAFTTASLVFLVCRLIICACSAVLCFFQFCGLPQESSEQRPLS